MPFEMPVGGSADIKIDGDGALMEALRDGVIEMSHLDGALSVEFGIQFEECLPQGPWEHRRVERRI